VEIKRVTISDAKELLDIYAHYVRDTAVSFEYEVPDIKEFCHRIETISAAYPYIKVTDGERILGYAYASSFKSRRAYDWSVETTIYVRAEERRRGIGRMLYKELERMLRVMGILNMNACIASPREADIHLTSDSLDFHTQMGFERVGTFHKSGFKFNTWYDMVWMEKMIGDHTETQQPVRFGIW